MTGIGLNIEADTLLNWEHGRRRPTGPAQVLLAMREMLR